MDSSPARFPYFLSVLNPFSCSSPYREYSLKLFFWLMDRPFFNQDPKKTGFDFWNNYKSTTSRWI
jgi:hypothetical protein